MSRQPVHFADRLGAAIVRAGGPAVVGIDPDFARLPAELRERAGRTGRASDQLDAIFQFAATVLQAVAPFAAAVKFQSAYFERYHGEGVDAYYSLIHEARSLGLLTIGDVKRNDIGSTAEAYAAGHLLEPAGQSVAEAEQIPLGSEARIGGDPTAEAAGEVLVEPDRATPDAITVNPYLGTDGIAPFIEAAAELGKGLFVLVRTSNPSAGQVQDFADSSGRKLYEHVASLVADWAAPARLIGQGGYSLVGAVVGATWPAQARRLRELMPNSIVLVPGYGAQGATADDCMASFRADGSGAIVNASRSILYAFDRPAAQQRFGNNWPAAIAQAAQDFRDDLAEAVARLRQRQIG